MPDTLTAFTSELCRLIRTNRRNLRFVTEGQLQEALAALFDAAGYTCERESRLSPCDRIDFLFAAPGVGVEVKVNGTVSALTGQLTRYAGRDQVRALVVVTNRVRHHAVPGEINGKPVHVVCLAGVTA